MDPDVTWGNGSGFTLVVHCWEDLQSVHGFRCYDNIAPCVLAIGACDSVAVNAKCLHLLYAWFTSVMLLFCAFTSHEPSVIELLHHQMSEATADDPRS